MQCFIQKLLTPAQRESASTQQTGGVDVQAAQNWPDLRSKSIAMLQQLASHGRKKYKYKTIIWPVTTGVTAAAGTTKILARRKRDK